MRPATVPLVNVRYWLEQLEIAGHLERRLSSRMLAAARRVFYADRTQPRLLSEFEKIVGADELCRLQTELSGGILDIKAADAREILVQLSRQLNPQEPA